MPTREEVEKEIAQVFEDVLNVCNGHPFAINKAALQLARDYMVRMETAAPAGESSPSSE